MWSTGFFDKNIVGTANALTGGWGNAGGGITYFVMPAVFDSFVAHGHSRDQAWRLAFIVPLVVLIITGLSLLLLCPDTPVGKWSERRMVVHQNLHTHGVDDDIIVAVPGSITDKPPQSRHSSDKHEPSKDNDSTTLENGSSTPNPTAGREASLSEDDMLQTARGEVIVKPSPREILGVALSPQSWTLMLCYACSFGGELAINSILSAYYLAKFPLLGQTEAASWAAMFGFLNVVTRPAGGVVADLLYGGRGGGTRGVWLKKAWVHVCGVLAGALLVVIGRTDPHRLPEFTGLIAVMAVFLEAGNGANFALVPHVHPHANGVVSGFTGAVGNLGGVVFAVIFRFMGGGADYAKAFWVIGCIHVGVNVLMAWVPPLPRGQIGGR